MCSEKELQVLELKHFVKNWEAGASLQLCRSVQTASAVAARRFHYCLLLLFSCVCFFPLDLIYLPSIFSHCSFLKAGKPDIFTLFSNSYNILNTYFIVLPLCLLLPRMIMSNTVGLGFYILLLKVPPNKNPYQISCHLKWGKDLCFSFICFFHI